MDHKQELLEKQLSKLTNALDIHLENIYGDVYPLHPSRMATGKGSNPAYDGLFATTASFTLGYGTRFGRGYIVNIDIRTLSAVSEQFKNEIREQAEAFINANLKAYFPDRTLNLVQDGNLLKIVGDFSLS